MSGSRRQLSVDADDVARQQNAGDDVNASLEHGCLKLGEDDIGEDNNNFELQPRHRFVSLYKLELQRVCDF